MSGSDTSNALNAIGTLIGYIGTEVATDDFFYRLLWPRRSYNGFSWTHIPKMVLLMPMGGPLHKAALSTLDEFCKQGLYERHQQGHMLGSPFYCDTRLRYRAYGVEGQPHGNEYVRNGLWIRAVMKTPFVEPPQTRGKDEEIGTSHRVRQKIFIGHLKLSSFSRPMPKSITKVLSVTDDAVRPGIRIYLALFATETTAVIMALLVAVIWRSAFAGLWLLPLVLKIVATLFTMQRETMDDAAPAPKKSDTEEQVGKDDRKLYSIRIPAGGFVLVESEDDVVLPFFRHHGHPKRSKRREFTLIAIVVSFTLIFPIGLVCSTLWMSDALQKLWVGYQLYATLAMYAYRYAGGHTWCTTEERLGELFADLEKTGDGSRMVNLESSTGRMIGAVLERSYYNKYSEAKQGLEHLIQKRRPKQLPQSPTLAPNDSQTSTLTTLSK